MSDIQDACMARVQLLSDFLLFRVIKPAMNAAIEMHNVSKKRGSVQRETMCLGLSSDTTLDSKNTLHFDSLC